MSEDAPSTIERAAAALGENEPMPDLVEAVGRHVDRGHHIAVVAAPGAGLGLLYGLAIERWTHPSEGDDVGGVRAVVLTPTAERAVELAGQAALRGSAPVVALPRAAPGLTAAGTAAFGTPADLLSAVRSGSLSLGEVKALILDGAALLDDQWTAVGALVEAAGAGATKIAATHRPDALFEEFVLHQMPRARRWPEELLPAPGTADPRAADSGDRGPELFYRTGPTRRAREEELVRALATAADSGGADRALVWCVRPEAVRQVSARLEAAGFALTDRLDAEAGVHVAAIAAATGDENAGAVIVHGLPARLDRFQAALGQARWRGAVVPPEHAEQLRIMATRAGLTPEASGEPLPAELESEIYVFRDRVEAELEAADLAAEGLLLLPLFERHGAVRVAAALASMLRQSDPGTVRDADRATRPTWANLYVNAGKRDGVQAGDLVGAITGETGASGGQIGKIDVRHGFSLVQVDALIAEDVIQGLHGVKLKNRRLEARFDREG